MTSAPRLPLRVLQGIGNARDLLPLLSHEAVDGIGVDIRVRDGEVSTGLPSRLPRLGALASRLLPARLLPAEAERVPLDALLRAVDGRSRLLIRVLDSAQDPAPEIARVLYPLPDRSHLLVCSEHWAVIDRLVAWLPGLRVAYLVTTEGPLRRYVQGRLDGSVREVPLLVQHTLIHTIDEARSLRGRAGALGAWAVTDAARARELAAWGLDLIASASIATLSGLSGDSRDGAS